MYRFEQVARLTTPAVLAAVAASCPDRSFVIAEDGELTYGRWRWRPPGSPGGSPRSGSAPASASACCCRTASAGARRCFGAHAAGLDVVPLNTWYREDELLAVAERARLRVIITQDEIFGLAVRAVRGRRGRAPRQRDRERYLGSFRWAPCGAGAVGRAGLVGGWERAWRAGAGWAVGGRRGAGRLRDAPVAGSDDALLIFTSGSSAEPKAVRLTQRGLVRTAHAVGERQGVRPGDRFWFASPLFFVFGCSNALPNALTHAATLCVQERFEARSALAFIERHRCTVYYAVAPITRALAAHPELAEFDISALRTGTANATPEDLRLAIEVLGVSQVCNAYGLTEGYGHSTITAWDDPVGVRTGSQGPGTAHPGAADRGGRRRRGPG